MSLMDTLANAKLDAATLAAMNEHLAVEMTRTAAKFTKAPTDWPLTTMPMAPSHTPPYVLTESDVARIASAVADELERRAAHPLRVTPADLARVPK